MEIMNNPHMFFSPKQIAAIESGKMKRERMKLLVLNVTTIHQKEKYSSLYIYSPPGLGKTHTVKEYLEISDIEWYTVTGNTSLFAFGIQLAVIQYLNPDRNEIIIHVDDCDEIFKNEQNCNTMKRLLDAEKKFVYEKSLTSQWPSLTDLQREAITHFGEEGKMGFVVPTSNIRFIFTSNFQLPNQDEVNEARKKGRSKAVLMSHRLAIRDRCKVADFDLDANDHWGWLSDVVLRTNCLEELELSLIEAISILRFLWDNWSYLNERSVRLVEKMAATMRNFPETYTTVWEIDHLKLRQYA